MTNKFNIQEEQYNFPYHYIPHFDNHGNALTHRTLDWGLEYFCYQMEIKQIIEHLNPSSVLDVGCGDGFLIGCLNDKIDDRVGVDFSERALRFARAFHPDIQFLCCDVDDVKNQFDVVVAVEVLEHIPEKNINKFVMSLINKTKIGGRVILCVPTTNVPLSKKHYRHYNVDLVKQHLGLPSSDIFIENIKYVYYSDWKIKIYTKLFSNRIWFFYFKPFGKLIWRHVWQKLRYANSKNGHHLIITLKRNSKQK